MPTVYPYKKLEVPSELRQYKNGQLPESVLAKVNTGGRMYAPVAAKFNALYDAALAAGHKLVNVGDYRGFDDQLKMFLDRYVTEDTGTGVTRQYDGKTWWLKKGKAPSAAPDPTGVKGSNHGWGLAIDLGYKAGNGKTASMGGACFDWMCENAPRFGFYLQGDNPKSKEFEAWHWQYAGESGSPAPAPAPAPAPTGAPLFAYPGTPLKVGSKGDAVKLVQAVVGAKADGDFGPKTAHQVGEWQFAHNLARDGVVGPVTWKAMFG